VTAKSKETSEGRQGKMVSAFEKTNSTVDQGMGVLCKRRRKKENQIEIFWKRGHKRRQRGRG